MSVQWTKDRAADSVAKILSKLDTVLNPTADGGVTLGWENELEYGAHIVADACSMEISIHEHQRLAITREAIIDAKRSKSLTPKSVLTNINRLQKQYLRKPLQPYVLLSSWSVSYPSQLPQVRISGSAVTFSRHKPRHFQLPQRVVRGKSLGDVHPMGYVVVRTSVRARDYRTAGDEALNRMDLLRGLWNFNLNYSTRRLAFGGGFQPLNNILLGPIHTLHEANGSAIDEVYWTEATYDKRQRPFALAAKLDAVKSFEQTARKLLARSKVRVELLELIVRYCRALDERDASVVYVRLWSILEDLTAIAPGDYETLVRRTRFLFSDEAYVKLVLQQLRKWRNQIVHDSHTPEGTSMFINDLKVYVEVLLWFLMRHPRMFHSMDDFGSFLSLPRDHDLLRHRIALHELALEL